jgi:cytochrome P450
MGYNFGSLENPDNEDLAMYHKLCVEPTKFFNWVELMSHYIDFKWLLYIPFKKNLEILEGTRYLRNLAKRIIEEKKAKMYAGKLEEHEKKDIVSVALASGGIKQGILVDFIMALIQGGQESTAATYQWAMWELARRPEMQRRLREEIRENLSPSLETTSGANINDLPFLHAICNETLRYHPYMPIMLRQAVTDTRICGEHIPNGTIILYSAYTMNRDERLWGPDANEFNPERWMAPGMAKTGGATTNFALTTFGHGPRGCFGQNFARVFLPCLIAAVIGRYEIELANGSDAGGVKFGFRNMPEHMWAKMRLVEGW